MDCGALQNDGCTWACEARNKIPLLNSFTALGIWIPDLNQKLIISTYRDPGHLSVQLERVFGGKQNISIAFPAQLILRWL